MDFKILINRYRRWRVNCWKEKARQKYDLDKPEERELVKGYFEIKFIKSQKLQQWLMIFLTIVLIYVTWINYA